MKRMYIYFKCINADNFPTSEFTEEIQTILKRAFRIFYFYFYGDDLKVFIMSIPFLKLIGRQVAKVVNNAVGKIPSFYRYFKNFYPSKRVSRNMFMFGHD